MEFINNWTGNIVATSNRIFQSDDSRSGSSAVGVIPISSFDGEIRISLNLTGFENSSISFYAKSARNGSGTRPVLLFFSNSIDGGASFGSTTQIGNDSTFPNSDGTYKQYTYDPGASTDNQSSVIVKIDIQRGSGSGSVARFLMDDVEIIANMATDGDPPLISSVQANSATQIDVQFNENLNETADVAGNYSINNGTSVSGATRDGTDNSLVHLTTSSLTLGRSYTLTVNGVQDEASNTIASNSMTNFSFISFSSPMAQDVVINEFLPDETPPFGVPQAEYVELYNRSGKFFTPKLDTGWCFPRHFSAGSGFVCNRM